MHTFYSSISKKFALVSLFLFLTGSSVLLGQQVDNKSCPDYFKRNNGNGQFYSKFAANITPGSAYYQNALYNNNEGTLTMVWGSNITNPPAITRTWITSNGLTTQNWSLGNNATGSPFNPPSEPSKNEVKYNFFNNNLPTAGVFTIQLEDPITGAPFATCSYNLSGNTSHKVDNVFGGVSSGSSGGLESESLGSALAERMYNNSVQGITEKINYSETPQMNEFSTRMRTDGLGIMGLMPDQNVLGTGFIGYITSPNDILNFTNAVEVMSVDYVEGGVNKAVAFCTKTQGEIYTHTKPVCDRLKGSELSSIDTLRSGNYKFLLYNLKSPSGVMEFAVSFSAGFNQKDPQYTLQSEWLTSTYLSQENMYNFQLWSSDLNLLNKMLSNVLAKLALERPMQQTGLVKKPATFITKADRDPKNQLKLILNVENQTAGTNGTLVIFGKENEQSVGTMVREFPVTLKPFGSTTIVLPVSDMAESEVHLLVNSIKEDAIYNSDGVWNIYKTPSTVINNYTVSNDSLQPLETDFRLFRNIKLEAITSDYVTVYRMVKGGGIAADISAYNYLKFKASGNSNVRIRLVSASVSGYDEQLEYIIPLKSQATEYAIPLSDFKSAGAVATPKLTDLLTISFSYEVSAPGTLLKAELSNVRFGEAIDSPELRASQIVAYPNPVRGRLNLEFESSVNENMDLELINAASGVTVSLKNIQVKEGKNSYSTDLNSVQQPGLYVVRLLSYRQKFVSKIQIN